MKKSVGKLLTLLLVVLIILIISKIMPYISDVLLFIGKIILPFFLGFTFAYILNPFVNFLQKMLKKRKYAVLFTILLIFIFFFFAVKGVYPFINKELILLADNLPSILDSLENKLNTFANNFSFLPEKYKPNFDNIIKMISNYFKASNILSNDFFGKIISSIGVIIITPVIFIYLLFDFEKIKNFIKEYLEKNNKNKFFAYLNELNTFCLSYVKTTLIVMGIMIALSSIIFFILGLEYPLFFGFIIGITNIIPYLGPYLGGSIPFLYALTNESISALVVLVVIIVIQGVETNFITPYLHSKRSETHPLFVILSLSVFGSLFGLLGMLFAVPLFKLLEITYKYYIKKEV